MLTKFIVLPLNRPQYVPAPEGFISMLAWELFEVPAVDKGKKIGYRFKKTELDKSYAKVDMRYNFPDIPLQLTLGNTLHAKGIIEPGDKNRIGAAVVNSVLGIRTEKSKFQPASPITPALALLQNYVGILGTENPPNLSAILESCYALGKGSGPSVGVAELWLASVEHRMQLDQLLRNIDESVNETLLESPRVRIGAQAVDFGGNVPFANSPFTWFAEVWPRLTSDEWTDALPAKVWTDWATTVLRLAFGLGYLFEVTWYETIATQLLGPVAPTWAAATNSMELIVPWQKSNQSTTNRDIASALKWKVVRGVAIRAILEKWISENKIDAASAADQAFASMHSDSQLRMKLQEALLSRVENGASKNVWEAIKFSLTVREQDGDFADHYGMFRRHNRNFLFVDPGTEWISVVASLSSAKPGMSVDLRKVMATLRLLGTEPDQEDLLSLLERAGIARGSADAGQAVVVKTAY